MPAGPESRDTRLDFDTSDFSTAEAERVAQAANGLVLDIARPMAHRLALYERTLGLAVVPVLLRRGIRRWWLRRHRQPVRR